MREEYEARVKAIELVHDYLDVLNRPMNAPWIPHERWVTDLATNYYKFLSGRYDETKKNADHKPEFGSGNANSS